MREQKSQANGILSGWVLRGSILHCRLIMVLGVALPLTQASAGDAPVFSKLTLASDGIRDSVGNPRPSPASFYWGARVKPIETTIRARDSQDAPKPIVRYHRAVMGFRLFLSENWYLFFGVGLAVPGEDLEAWTARITPFTAGELQNSVVMVTEYGLAWMF